MILLRRSKTDKAGGGYHKGIPHGGRPETCPVTHLGAWTAHLGGAEEGPVFRAVDRHGNVKVSPMALDSVSRAVKKRAQKAGLDPSRCFGHSLRAGFVTAASEGGAPHDKDTVRQTAHLSLTTLHRYRRTVGLFENNPASLLGL